MLFNKLNLNWIIMEFVTYEIGKKLQEKGYLHGYNRFGYRPIYSDECTIKYINHIGAYEEEYYGECIPCPTIDEVLKWLRDDKKIYIIVEPFPCMATNNKICWSWKCKWDSDGVYDLVLNKKKDLLNKTSYSEIFFVPLQKKITICLIKKLTKCKTNEFY